MTTCADDDSLGSLRAIIASANTSDGDTIDLTQLPTTYGCSTITLDDSLHNPAYIKISQSDLHLLGPGSSALTITAGAHSSVLRHDAYGTLDIDGVTIAHGKYASDTHPFGGCIYSKGNVTLQHARVEHCEALSSSSTVPAGGGLYVKGDLTLYRSSVSDGKVVSTYGTGSDAYGGGASVHGDLQANYSTISGNYTLADNDGVAGGVFVFGNSNEIKNSTISGNKADFDSGLYFGDTMGSTAIINSTISGNEVVKAGGALFARGDLTLANSTIAFNRAHATNDAGVNAGGPSLVLQSSIIAGNIGASAPADLTTQPTTVVTGSNNLIVAAAAGTSTPPLTITDCPQLEPLADNGGPTLTHAIKLTSPARDMGDPGNLTFDQTGFSRVYGAAADIGAFEWRDGYGNERIFVSGFDGLCDQ